MPAGSKAALIRRISSSADRRRGASQFVALQLADAVLGRDRTVELAHHVMHGLVHRSGRAPGRRRRRRLRAAKCCSADCRRPYGRSRRRARPARPRRPRGSARAMNSGIAATGTEISCLIERALRPLRLGGFSRGSPRSAACCARLAAITASPTQPLSRPAARSSSISALASCRRTSGGDFDQHVPGPSRQRAHRAGRMALGELQRPSRRSARRR